MRLLQVRARTDEEAECLMRELAVYSPTRSRRAVLVELEARSESAVLGVLAAVETCLSANEIASVHVELDGRSYLLAMSESFDPLQARRFVQGSPAARRWTSS